MIMTKKREGAFAIILWDDKVLLFHRDNIPSIPFPDCWQLPGGTLEYGETALEALKRELDEEVSYVPENIIFLKKLQTKLGETNAYLCIVNDLEAKKFKHGPGEGQEIAFFTLQEALKIKLTPLLKRAFEKANILIQKGMPIEQIATKLL